MSDNWGQGWPGDAPVDFTANDGGVPCGSCNELSHSGQPCPYEVRDEVDNEGADDTSNNCFGCGQPGHRRAECPDAEEMTCRYCKEPGHMMRDCPTKPAMVCENCGEEGHAKRTCENPRKINRDDVLDMAPDVAWAKIKKATEERDADDVKEAIQEYVKALDGQVTYRDLQQGLINDEVNLWLIALERPISGVYTNMNFQGVMGQRYSISYRFSEKPERPREIEGWPQSRDDLLQRLDDAGDIVNSGKSKCRRCLEVGHTTKFCTQERMDTEETPRTCSNCGDPGHRLRDCTEPRRDPFACKNCKQSGHKAADCPEPPNAENVECRRCNESGHFAKDCPTSGGQGCRNCGEEGHIAKDCEKPRNMDNVTCRNCEKTGHFSRDCPEPKDWSKVQCSNCEQYGHTKVRCRELPKEDHDEYANDNAFGATQDSTFGGGYDKSIPVEVGGVGDSSGW